MLLTLLVALSVCHGHSNGAAMDKAATVTTMATEGRSNSFVSSADSATSLPSSKAPLAEAVTTSPDKCDGYICRTAPERYLVNTSLCAGRRWVSINASASSPYETVEVWTDPNDERQEVVCRWGITVPKGHAITILLDHSRSEYANVSLDVLSQGYRPGYSDRNSLMFVQYYESISSLSFYYRSGHPHDTPSLPLLHFYVTEDIRNVFSPLPDVKVSDTLGYVTSPFYDGINAFVENFNGLPAFFIIHVPKMHSVLTSFIHFSMLKSELDYLSLSVIHENLTETEVWRKSGQQLISSQIYRTSIRLYADVFHDTPESSVSFFDVVSVGFNMTYVIMARLEEPVQVAENLFNCSVPSFPSFKELFRCNLVKECVGGEDEEGCEAYSEDCGEGAFDIGTKCYTVSKPDRPTTWNEAKAECVKHGHKLVTMATVEEWKQFRQLLAFFKLGVEELHVGLRITERTGSKALTALYRWVWEWVDQRTAFNILIDLYDQKFEFGQSNCATYITYLGSMARLFCWSSVKHHIVCQFNKQDRNKETEIPKWISIKDLDATSTYFKIRVQSCPSGHVTRDFLSCDPESQCGVKDYLKSCKTDSKEVPLFSCQKSQQTVHYTVVCDHVQHCLDNSDESFCEHRACPAGFGLCRNKQCVASGSFCDGVLHCTDGSDESCSTLSYPQNNDSSVSQPTDVTKLFPSHAEIEMHNGTMSVRPMNVTDECQLTHFKCPGGYCLPIYLRCNGVDDCYGREDEVSCDSYTCPGYYRCRDSAVCLHPDHVCDGVAQCPQLDDEMLCGELPCPDACQCQGLAFVCTATFSARSYPALRYLDASGSGLTPNDLLHNFYLIGLHLSNTGMDIVPTMTFPNLQCLDLSRNTISHINMQSFRFLKNLRVLVLSKNPLQWMTNTVPDREIINMLAVRGVRQLNANLGNNTTMKLKLHSIDLSYTRLEVHHDTVFSSCPDLKVLNISRGKPESMLVTNDGFKSTPNLEVLDMKGARLKTFPNDLLKGLAYLRLVYTENYKLCCRALLPDGFNVDNCHTKQDLLASCEDLLRSDGYRVFLWTFASMAVVGNVGSLVVRLYLYRDGSSQGSFSIFVTNLSLADFLMGVYLIMVGVADHIYRGEYLWHDDQWKRSVACRVAGFLSLVSSEVSAFTISLITLDRLLALRFPFSRFHFGRRSALVSCCSSWVLGIVLAAVPLLPMTSHWDFYSQTGICTPLPFSGRDTFQGQPYSFSVTIALNFVLFLLIAVGPHLLLGASHFQGRLPKDRITRRHCSTRLTTIVVSDFLCWFPIGLLGLLAYTGTAIPGEVNVALAIFVLPLNSALNPFLYTFNAVMERRRKARVAQLMDNLEMRFHSTLSKENARGHLKHWLNNKLLNADDVLTTITSTTQETVPVPGDR